MASDMIATIRFIMRITMKNAKMKYITVINHMMTPLDISDGSAKSMSPKDRWSCVKNAAETKASRSAVSFMKKWVEQRNAISAIKKMPKNEASRPVMPMMM